MTPNTPTVMIYTSGCRTGHIQHSSAPAPAAAETTNLSGLNLQDAGDITIAADSGPTDPHVHQAPTGSKLLATNSQRAPLPQCDRRGAGAAGLAAAGRCHNGPGAQLAAGTAAHLR